jgi:hypothetical protein
MPREIWRDGGEMSNCCEKCEFVERVEYYKPNRFRCRRFPPMLGKIYYEFPWVEKNDWCGEFKEKINEN